MKHSQLTELLADHQSHHSDWQIDHYILGANGGTIYGRYKQALRELVKRWRGLKGLYIELELVTVAIEERDAALPAQTTFEARRRDLERTQKRMALEDLERNIADTAREFGRFYAHAVALKEAFGALTTRRRADLDRGMWLHQIQARAAMDFLTHGGLSTSTTELLLSIPSEYRKPILAECHESKRKALMQWILDYDAPLPELPELNGEVEQLIAGLLPAAQSTEADDGH